MVLVGSFGHIFAYDEDDFPSIITEDGTSDEEIRDFIAKDDNASLYLSRDYAELGDYEECDYMDETTSVIYDKMKTQSDEQEDEEDYEDYYDSDDF